MAQSKLHSKVGKRVRALCGFCAMHENAETTRSSNTQHIILKVEKDDELEMMMWLIECRNCGCRSEIFPKAKMQSRAELLRLRAMLDTKKSGLEESNKRWRAAKKLATQ